MRVLFIGSKFMSNLATYITNAEVTDIIVGYNPLGDELCDVVRESVKNNSPDAVFVDLMMCAHWLYKSAGDPVIKTLSNPEVSVNEVFNPAEFRFSKFDSNFNAFVRLLEDLFCDKPIFLIKSTCPSYLVIKEQLREMSKVDGFKQWKKSSLFVQKKEDRFIKNIKNCLIIDISKFYFVKKIVGKEIDFCIFEDELYIDINRWILEYKCGSIRNTPSYDLCVKRYINYQFKTIHYKAFLSFLKKDDLTDEILMCSTRKYAIENERNFIALKKWTKNRSNNEIEKTILNNDILEYNFRHVVYGFTHMKNYDIDKTIPEKCREMFSNGIVSSSVKNSLREYWQKAACLNRNKINSHNAGYYYAKMQGYPEKEAINFAEPKCDLSPILIDVYGSCIAYNPINEFMSGVTSVVCNKYYMHVPCYESSKVPIMHPGVSFDKEPANVFEKNVRLQFEHKIEMDIMESDSEWCLIDLYSFMTPATFLYNDFCFTNYGDKTWKLLGAEKIRCWDGYYQNLINDQKFLKSINTWIEWIKNKYGEKIIIINFKPSEIKIGDDDKLYYAYKNAEIQDELVQKLYLYIKEKMKSYCINFSRNFLPDDMGYNSSSRVHYELDFYAVVGKTIEYIVTEKPQQKNFENYSNEIRVNRIIRLRQKNDPYILNTYFTDSLDKIILKLPYDCLKNYKNEIISFYNNNMKTLPEILDQLWKMKKMEFIGMIILLTF